MTRILWIIAVVLIGLWVVGLIARIASGLIHLLLLAALAIFVYNLVMGRKGTV